VKALVAWRMLSHEKGRSGLAIAGVFVAILLVFVQLGFYTAVPRGGLLFYDAMRFDLMLTSTTYVFQPQSADFPRRRLFQAMAIPEVASATAVYHDSALWLNEQAGLTRDIFVIAFDPKNSVFNVDDINRQIEAVKRPDTIIVDSASRPEFGELRPERQIEIAKRAITIGGVYHMGVGFVGLGVGITSDINFIRMFPNRSLGDVNLGLITLKDGANPDAVAARLRQIMPADTQVFTRSELARHEMNHWTTRTSTGLIFGFGTIVAFVVGLVILNQTLNTQVIRQLPQYATLKAMGYTDAYLSGIVATLAIFMSTISYVPATALAMMVYWIVRNTTTLPVEMTLPRALSVLAGAWAMSVVSAVLALRVLRKAEPVELF
jgi:putative ABC transport system permease protein